MSVVVQTDKLELGEPSVDMGSGPSLAFCYLLNLNLKKGHFYYRPGG